MRHTFERTPTAQEVFNAACAYFAISPGPSTIETNRYGRSQKHDCVYRSPNGRVCIVGYFLPDAAYVPEMDDPNKYDDGSDANALVRHYGDRVPAWFAQHQHLLRSIQSVVHDDEYNWQGGMNGTWHRERVAATMRSIADDYGIPDLSAIDVIWKAPNWNEVEA